MDIWWGNNNNATNLNIPSRKRKRTVYEGDDVLNSDIPFKLFSRDKSVYTIGNQVHFTASVNKESIEKMIRKITKIINLNNDKYKDSGDTLEIVYIVDTPGGSVISMLKFIDFIKMAKKNYPYLVFTSIITGLVASAGTTMCVCADNRYITQYAHTMIHELSAGNDGNYQQLMSYSKYLTSLHGTINSIYLEKCSISKDELETMMSRETWFNAKEYLEAGFVTKII